MSRARNPAEALRDLMVPLADQLGLEVDHEALDQAARYCNEVPARCRDRGRAVVPTAPAVAAPANACPDCGARYQGESYFCPECTERHVAEGHAPHDVARGDLSHGDWGPE